MFSNLKPFDSGGEVTLSSNLVPSEVLSIYNDYLLKSSTAPSRITYSLNRELRSFDSKGLLDDSRIDALRELSIAIVDDDEFTCEIIEFYLEDQDVDTQSFTSVNDLFNVSAHYRPDIILLDFNLVDISGIKAISYVRGTYPNSCIISMSGNDTPSNVNSVLEAGCVSFLAKPLLAHNLKELIHLVANLGRQDELQQRKIKKF